MLAILYGLHKAHRQYSQTFLEIGNFTKLFQITENLENVDILYGLHMAQYSYKFLEIEKFWKGVRVVLKSGTFRTFPEKCRLWIQQNL